MDNERVTKELVRIAKELTGKGSASKKYVKDVERMSNGAIATGKTLSGNLNGVSRALSGGDPSVISDEIDNALSGFEVRRHPGPVPLLSCRWRHYSLNYWLLPRDNHRLSERWVHNGILAGNHYQKVTDVLLVRFVMCLNDYFHLNLIYKSKRIILNHLPYTKTQLVNTANNK